MNRHGESPYASPRTPPAETVGTYKWAVVGMLWFICFFNYADRQAIAAILPALQDEFGFDEAELGLISSSFMWVYALTAPFAGITSDRFPRKLLIIGGLYVWSIITGFTALCSKLWHFVAVRGAEGLGETFYFPASMSLVSDYHAPRTRSRAMSMHQTSVYAGTIGGSLLAGWMTDVFGDWRVAFVTLGAAGVVLGAVLGRFIIEPRRNQAELAELGQASREIEKVPLAQFLGELHRRPAALALTAAFFGANFVAFVFITWMPTYLKKNFGLSLTAAGFSGAFFLQVASMCGAFAGGFLADRWARRAAGGRMFSQAVGALAGAPFILLCGFTRELPILLFGLTIFGLFKGIYDANIWASLYDVVPPARRSTAVGMMNMVGWLGAGLGTFLTGYVVKHGWTMSQAVASTAVIYLGVAAMLLFCGAVLAPREMRITQAEGGS